MMRGRRHSKARVADNRFGLGLLVDEADGIDAATGALFGWEGIEWRAVDLCRIRLAIQGKEGSALVFVLVGPRYGC